VKKALAALLPLTALAACATPLESTASPMGVAIIRNDAGAEIGTARLFGQGDAVTINIALNVPGGSAVHAVHLHETGTCTAPGFTSAGGHLNPAGKQHGMNNPQGSHLGDLPNITLSASGTGSASATLPGTMASVTGQIFDPNGTAIVVHAAADDYVTDPTGGAGGRIACGVFQRS
jgi:Cu-Zn family superoxide dismutase